MFPRIINILDTSPYTYGIVSISSVGRYMAV
jgi:hypothetical protein